MKEKFPNPKDKVREQNVIQEEDDEYIDEDEEEETQHTDNT